MTALEIAGISPEEVKRLTAKFCFRPVNAPDKNGAEATANAPVISKWIEVTPEMAGRWLKSNFNNRPMSDHTVNAYARDMLAGRWQPTHQGIAFNDADRLIDGQHRLAAVMKARIAVRMMVTFGLPEKIAGTEQTTMDCVDRGRTRSVGDQLKIQHGLKNGTQIAQVCSSLAHLCLGEHVRRLSVGHTLDVYRAFQPGVDYVIEHRVKQSGLRSAGVLAAFAFAHGVKGADVKYRLARLNTGEEAGQSPPIESLRALLTGQQSAMIVGSMNKGLAELVCHVIWTDMFRPSASALEMKPEEWLKAVEFFREQQRGTVDGIAALFKLPVAEERHARFHPGPLPQERENAHERQCECGKKYVPKNHWEKVNGCPDCRAANVRAGVVKNRRVGMKPAAYSMEEAA